MPAVSKILIAYDGSECSDAALDDLKRSGLPESLDAILVTLADVLPPFAENPSVHIPHRVAKAIHAASRMGALAGMRLREDFPKWDVRLEVECAASAWSLVKIGVQDRPDLIIVGSHRHFVAGGRLILGSVSQRLLYDTQCSVRVARCAGKRSGPIRIVVGFNGTPQADVAVDAVLSRAWPEGTKLRIVTANERVDSGVIDAVAARLRGAHLETSHIFRSGKPASVLVQEALEWDADSIFLGTNNLHGYQHLLHGSVAATVAAHAQCSVEVVRSATARQLAA